MRVCDSKRATTSHSTTRQQPTTNNQHPTHLRGLQLRHVALEQRRERLDVAGLGRIVQHAFVGGCLSEERRRWRRSGKQKRGAPRAARCALRAAPAQPRPEQPLTTHKDSRSALSSSSLLMVLFFCQDDGSEASSHPDTQLYKCARPLKRFGSASHERVARPLGRKHS